MARRFSASQARNKIRQAQRKQQQAINKHNQAVRRHNQQVRRDVNKYNQEVRAYNARVRANRRRINSELAKLNRQATVTRYVVLRTSVQTLYDSYARLDERAEAQGLDSRYSRVLDLSEREAANSLEVMNSLLGTEPDRERPMDELEDAALTDELRRISADLDNRWKGAIYALSPQNPDAARHFCTSAREVITQILELTAPDSRVLDSIPNCPLTPQGKPTRRAKIKFLLDQKGMTDETLAEFVEQDIENVVQLFFVLNDGTHGSAGTFERPQLAAIKKRVEDAIMFLSQIAA